MLHYSQFIDLCHREDDGKILPRLVCRLVRYNQVLFQRVVSVRFSLCVCTVFSLSAPMLCAIVFLLARYLCEIVRPHTFQELLHTPSVIPL
ncbi:hypothetical protein LSH36_589g01045 [Paralvinella palmiformis]|uniref:Uncharacterized protein n=1 Tax=Paralvinella palmiformis TaxID=53620 RepID=A0AAD9J4V7_9ANNE|nr:hypothetical protein LSH36_589g01045 [Paralvinella palmiformis]